MRWARVIVSVFVLLGAVGCNGSNTPDPKLPWWKQQWAIPERSWPDCTTEHATSQSLADKAAYYQWIVPRMHRLLGDTGDGRHIVHALLHHTCLDDEHPGSIVPDDQLPTVVRFESYGNAGLWTSLYVASQAFRYALAKQEQDRDEQEAALAEVRITLEATYKLLRITGKPGLYARGYWSPLSIFEHPEPTGEKHHIASGELAGYSWQGDVSQDEYSGHMYALGVVARLVDDEQVQAICRDIASQVGNHLKDNSLWIIDVDGEVTTFGKMNAYSLTHFPGYNAWLSLAWLKITGLISGEQELIDYYSNCLLQKQGENKCIKQAIEPTVPYTDHLDTLDIMQGCATNHDSVSMAFLAAANLIWYEEDEPLRGLYQQVLHDKLMVGDPDGPQITEQNNPFFNMIYAAYMDYDDPEATPPEPLIRAAICTLKEFPADQRLRPVDLTHHPEYCTSERHGSLAEQPIPWREHPPYLFQWWRNPRQRQVVDGTERCGDLPTLEPPADYLLPYYMGRYFGWITPGM